MLSFEKTVDDDKYADVNKDQSVDEDGDKYKHTLPVFRLNFSK